MGRDRRGGGGGLGEDEQEKTQLQAIVLADSFTQIFRPLTLVEPKVLLELGGVAMLDYTLAWLASCGVDEAFVFCCSNADKVVEHLEKYDGNLVQGEGHSGRLHTVVSTACTSAGEALRLIYEQNIIRTDFVLISGDTLTNINLGPVVEKHRARRKKDPDAIMTLIASKASNPAIASRLGREDLLTVYDPDTTKLVHYEQCDRDDFISTSLDAALFGEHAKVKVRTDLMDTHIDVCSPEVLGIMNDNFDYQHLRKDFVMGVISEEELGKKIYIEELEKGYAVNVQNLRSYDAVAQDVVSQWVWPYSLSTGVLLPQESESGYSHRWGREDITMQDRVSLGKDTVVGTGTVVGHATIIGDKCRLARTVIGSNCRIGSGVVLEGSTIQDDVIIGDGVRVYKSIICREAVINAGATVNKGCLIDQNVMIAHGHELAPGTKVTTCHVIHDHSDDEDEFEDAVNVIKVMPGEPVDPEYRIPESDEAVVGAGGHGWRWECTVPSEGLVPKPPNIAPCYDSAEAVESLAQSLPNMKAGEDDPEEALDPESLFAREVQETVLRCEKEQFAKTNAIVELNALKLAEDRTFADCARFIFTTIMGLCLPAPASVPAEFSELFPDAAPAPKALVGAAQAQIGAWSMLLEQFLRQEDDQVELLLTFEEYCLSDGVFHVDQGERFGHGPAFVPVFAQMLNALYQSDILSEEAILTWADEKEHADEEEKFLLKKAQAFIDWLREAEEDESSEEDDDGEEEESD